LLGVPGPPGLLQGNEPGPECLLPQATSHPQEESP
jgi:hypothetical protein